MNENIKKSIGRVVLLAAGKSVRTAGVSKQWEKIGGQPVFAYSLNVFLSHPQVEQVVLVVRREDNDKAKKWLKDHKIGKVIVAMGGGTRQESAIQGFKKLKNLQPNDIVLFHNAANPLVTQKEITEVLRASQKYGAACVGHPATATLKKLHNGFIEKTVNRETMGQAETPQAMTVDLYKKALKKRLKGTDEMSLVEQLRLQPKWILASPYNFKITTQRDLDLARFLIEGGTQRTGIGQDSHRFSLTKKGLTLGGVFLKKEPKMIANSDGDVMIHALCNALLQALGEGYSLGKIADPMCLKKGVKNSRKYLDKILKKMNEKGFKIHHVGFQLEGKRPKIDLLTPRLKKSMATILGLTEGQIGITATSGEDLTPFGRGEGLQCFAVVTLKFII
ncbi:MAG: 2-C-methyl-D-erythritol 2,4-cyclodiphosphate synthase [Candidatus Gracilibacteria bacterium]